MRVSLNFVEDPKGDLMDLYGTPSGKLEPPENAALQRNPESVERLRGDLEKTYDFVMKRFGIDNRIR
jgi:hypothetical protein